MDLKFILFLCLTWGLQVSSSADGGQDGGYDAAAQLADRRTRYLEACDKMTSRLRPHTRKALMVGEGEWESAVIPKMKVDPVNGYAICAVNSIQFWDSLVFNTSMTALMKADPAGQTDGEEPDPEQQTTAKTLQIWSMFAQKTIKEKSEMLGKFKRFGRIIQNWALAHRKYFEGRKFFSLLQGARVYEPIRLGPEHLRGQGWRKHYSRSEQHHPGKLARELQVQEFQRHDHAGPPGQTDRHLPPVCQLPHQVPRGVPWLLRNLKILLRISPFKNLLSDRNSASDCR